MMRAYDSLSAFPDVEKTMQRLEASPHIKAIVFSNGTHSMVSSSVNNSPGLSEHAENFAEIVTVDDVRKFKPAPEAYHHLAKKMGKDPKDENEMSEIWLVSGNPFDIVGARAVGMSAIWVDRAGTGWQDSLLEGEKGRPTEVVKSLDMVVPAVLKTGGEEVAGIWDEMHGQREV